MAHGMGRAHAWGECTSYSCRLGGLRQEPGACPLDYWPVMAEAVGGVVVGIDLTDRRRTQKQHHLGYRVVTSGLNRLFDQLAPDLSCPVEITL